LSCRNQNTKEVEREERQRDRESREQKSRGSIERKRERVRLTFFPEGLVPVVVAGDVDPVVLEGAGGRAF